MSSNEKGSTDEPNELRRCLGQEIERRRNALEMTQGDFGKLIDKSTTTVSAIERGKRPVDYELLVKIARVLGVSTFELLWKGAHRAELLEHPVMGGLVEVYDTLLNQLPRPS